MSSRKKNPAADRSRGGPGSSHEDASDPPPAAPHRAPDYQPVRSHRSGVSGGGGERDLHHDHDPRRKS